MGHGAVVLCLCIVVVDFGVVHDEVAFVGYPLGRYGHAKGGFGVLYGSVELDRLSLVWGVVSAVGVEVADCKCFLGDSFGADFLVE